MKFHWPFLIQQENDDVEYTGSRRSTRTRSQTVFFTQEPEEGHENESEDDADEKFSNASVSDDDDDNDDNDNDNGEEEEEEATPVLRKSSRSTAFRGAMKDPGNSIADLLRSASDSDSHAKNNRKPAKQQKRSSLESSGKEDEDDSSDASDVPAKKYRRASSQSSTIKNVSSSKGSSLKSPAKRHSRKRMTKRLEYPESESSEDEDDDDDEHSEDGEDNDDMKINKIIAAKSLTLREWKQVCEKMNTTEITNGSRWIQEEDPLQDPEKYEERFLIKWDGLSYLHCSWETEKDLVEFIDGAKNRLSTFFRKSENGLLFDADERLDGDYFDPSWTQIERILEVDTDDESGKKNADNDRKI